VDGGKFADEPLEAFDTGRMAEFGAFLSDANDDGIDRTTPSSASPSTSRSTLRVGAASVS
jgi:hypothetical protein